MNRIKEFAFLFLMLSLHCCAFCGSLQQEVNSLLEEVRQDNSTQGEVVKKLSLLGAESAEEMASMLWTRDIMKLLTLRAALSAMDATASPALQKYIKLPEHESEVDTERTTRRAQTSMGILSEMGNPSDLEFFLKYTTHSNWKMRAQALRGIGRAEIISATVAGYISPALSDPDQSVRRYAVGAMGRVASASQVPALLHSLGDESFFVRRAAKRSIERIWKRSIGDGTEVQALISLTIPEVPSPQALLAVELLALRIETKATERLKELATNNDWAIRAGATNALMNEHSQWVEENLPAEGESNPMVLSILGE